MRAARHDRPVCVAVGAGHGGVGGIATGRVQRQIGCCTDYFIFPTSSMGVLFIIGIIFLVIGFISFIASWRIANMLEADGQWVQRNARRALISGGVSVLIASSFLVAAITGI